MEKTSIVKYSLPFFIVASLFFAGQVFAADLSFSPSSGTYIIGQTFPVAVEVSSTSQSANAVSGTITFTKDTLKVASISKSNSIVSIWVQDPTFSNDAGTINFEGIILTPGYQGSSGNIITVNFKPIARGSAKLAFSSGAVLANDGQGTNILSNVGTASFSLVPASPVASVPPISKLIKTEKDNVSQQISNAVQEPNFFNISSLIITVVIFLIIIAALIFFFGFLFLVGWRKIRSLIKELKEDVQKLEEVDIQEKRALGNLQQTANRFDKNIRELAGANVAEDQLLATLSTKLEDKTTLLNKHVDELEKFGTAKAKELESIKQTVEQKDTTLEKNIHELEDKNKAQNQELTSVQERLASNINAKSTALESDLAQLKAQEALLRLEIESMEARLESKIDNMSTMFRNDLNQIKETGLLKQELARIEERLESKIQEINTRVKPEDQVS